MLEFAIECAKNAGKILLSFKDRQKNLRNKSNRINIVTQADIESEQFLLNAINSKFPEHAIISEESGIVNPASKNFWIIDPLDGTSNYAAGLDWFGVMIAYVENCEIKFGIAYIPSMDYVYFAAKDEKAFRNLEQISVNSDVRIENALCAFGIDAEENNTLNMQFKILRRLASTCRNIRSTNCLLDFCYTADGKFGGVINFNTRIWDIAAVSIIIRESGGIITDTKGEAIKFNLSNSLIEKEYEVVAGTPNIYSTLLEMVKESENDSTQS